MSELLVSAQPSPSWSPAWPADAGGGYSPSPCRLLSPFRSHPSSGTTASPLSCLTRRGEGGSGACRAPGRTVCGSGGNTSHMCLSPSTAGKSYTCAHTHGCLNTCANACPAHATCPHVPMLGSRTCMHVSAREREGRRVPEDGLRRARASLACAGGRRGVHARGLAALGGPARRHVHPSTCVEPTAAPCLWHVSNETVPLLPCSLIKHAAC